MNFDLTSNVPEKAVLKVEGEMTLNDLNKPCHGVVLWMEYHLTDAWSSSGGLMKVSDGGREVVLFPEPTVCEGKGVWYSSGDF